jgi:hypothetical protein
MERKRQVLQTINQSKCFLYTGNYVNGKNNKFFPSLHSRNGRLFHSQLSRNQLNGRYPETLFNQTDQSIIFGPGMKEMKPKSVCHPSVDAAPALYQKTPAANTRYEKIIHAF